MHAALVKPHHETRVLLFLAEGVAAKTVHTDSLK